VKERETLKTLIESISTPNVTSSFGSEFEEQDEGTITEKSYSISSLMCRVAKAEGLKGFASGPLKLKRMDH